MDPPSPTPTQRVHPLRSWYDDVVGGTPLFTRCYVMTAIVVTVASFVLEAGPEKKRSTIAVDGYDVFERGEVYRLFLSTLAMRSVFGLVFASVSFWRVGSKLERMWGTVRTGIATVTYSLGINAITLASTIAFAYNPLYAIPDAMFLQCQGLWSVIVCLVTIECEREREDARRKFLLWSVSARLYPLVLLVLFAILTGRFAIDLVVGYALGRLQASNLFGELMPVGPQGVRALESSEGGMREQRGFIALDDAGRARTGGAVEDTNDAAPAVSRNARSSGTRLGGGVIRTMDSTTNHSPGNRTKTFPGSGNVLGTTDENP